MKDCLEAQCRLLQETSYRAESAASELHNALVDVADPEDLKRRSHRIMAAVRELHECAAVGARAAGATIAVSDWLESQPPSKLTDEEREQILRA